MWVTFYFFFTCNRMIKLKIALKRSELHCNWVRWLIWKLEHLVNTPQLAILLIKVCWGNWNVSPHAGTIHMTCTVICCKLSFTDKIRFEFLISSIVWPSWECTLKLLITPDLSWCLRRYRMHQQVIHPGLRRRTIQSLPGVLHWRDQQMNVTAPDSCKLAK